MGAYSGWFTTIIMGLSKNLDLVIKNKAEPAIGIGLLVGWASSFILSEYLIWSPIQVFYFILLLLTLTPNEEKKGRAFYGILSMVLLMCFVLTKSKVFFLTGFLYFYFFLIEKKLGKIGFVPLFAAIMVTPFSKYVLDIVSFPVRLQLTELVGKSLKWVYPNMYTQGNVIYLDDVAFAIDEACMGLNLLQTGLLISLLILARSEHKSKKYYRFQSIIGYLILVAGLLILGNAFRIMGIVFFKAMPNTLPHELIGILCLIIYVFVPIYFLVKRWSPSFLKPIENTSKSTGIPGLQIILTIGFLTIGYFSSSFKRSFPLPLVPNNIEQYQQKALKDNVLQLKNDNTLIYIKPGVPFYAGDHVPKVCWRGEGYTFLKEEIRNFDQQSIITAILKTPENTLLYTAWWYNNSLHHTIHQWEWRWDVFMGAPPYQLINITSTSPQERDIEIQKWLNSLE